MQRVLEKMARKLNEYDEASLMHLWQHYASQVHEFEPSKRWEEAAIALCLIQAVHWKNQLFNYHLAMSASPLDRGDMPPLPDFLTERSLGATDDDAAARPKATVLQFPDKGKKTPVVGGGEGGEDAPTD
jgi:hypothetical protein